MEKNFMSMTPQKELESLIDFWKKLDLSKKQKIHSEDVELISAQINDSFNYDETAFNYMEDKKERRKFQSSLIPQPYIGNLRTANIFILSLNPGFEFCDYHSETENADFRKALEDTLYQNFNDDGYFAWPFNPKFLWTSGAKYWLKKINTAKNSLIEEFIEQEKTKGNDFSFSQAIKLFSKKIAFLEVVPYHSREFSFSKYKKLPSTKKMFDFIKGYVIPKAENGEALLLVLRKGSELQEKELLNESDIKRCKGNIFIYGSSKSQSASLSAQSEAGKTILDFLKK